MEIKRSIEKNGNLAPAAWDMISAISDEFSYHTQHGKRHPKTIYKKSIESITSKWIDVFNLLENIQINHESQSESELFTKLLEEYKELLYRLNEHTDACISIVRVYCPPINKIQKKFDTQYLEKSKFPGWKKFYSSIKPYKEDHIGALVNTMKHGQGELKWLYFSSSNIFIPGYFLQDVLQNGVLGPSEKIHSNGKTAFSFSRDMMIHLWQLYSIGENLSSTLRSAIKTLYNLDIKKVNTIYPDNNWTKVLIGCGKLEPIFFPDEMKKKYPKINITSDHKEIVIKFPEIINKSIKYEDMTISLHFDIDENHLTNKIPYFGHEYQSWIQET